MLQVVECPLLCPIPIFIQISEQVGVDPSLVRMRNKIYCSDYVYVVSLVLIGGKIRQDRDGMLARHLALLATICNGPDPI